ncbi:LysR family transcriptional regulator [Vibrio sp. FNV 38]|nr:LysR family transcriptional regulator [Vibrio sp. FNV 38]
MANTSVEQLLAFVNVAQAGSYSKAAVKLKKSRSTLHQQVESLEIDWGLPLFQRTGRAPELTKEGRSLLPKAKHILEQLDSLERACENLSSGGVSEMTVGYDMTIPVEVIRTFDLEMAKQYPNMRINWLKMSRSEALAKIIEKTCDLAITLNVGNKTPESGVSFVNLGYPELLFYTDENSSLAQYESVSIDELEYSTQLLCGSLLETSHAIQAQLSSSMKVVNSMDLLLSLLKDDGFALIPKHYMVNQPPTFKELNLSFMLKGARIGYILLANPNLQENEPHKALSHLICTWFDSLD